MPNTHGPIEQEVKDQMNAMGEALDEVFNGKDYKTRDRKWGFALLIFKFGEDDGNHRMNYISNAERKQIIKALKEFISRDERNT